jgi:hypothetical protein
MLASMQITFTCTVPTQDSHARYFVMAHLR